MIRILIVVILFAVFFSLNCTQENLLTAEQWQEIELDFSAISNFQNPYKDVEFWVEFTHTDGTKLKRPGFWYKNNIWKVRFTSPSNSGIWEWESFCSNEEDEGLHGQRGKIQARPYSGTNHLIKKGLLKISPKKRNVIHSNGECFLIIGDTPWALPWRGTVETVTEYAKNRQERGFNCALLMSLQPDRDVQGPENRTDAGGFAVAFEDLKEGHINLLNPEYFIYFDSLRNILLNHEIVPVLQPVFHGFGWKGKNVLGWNVDPEEFAWYTRYLVARYGAQPAMWLVGADSDGRDPSSEAGGKEVEKWDCYQQPTGLHYSPFCEVTPDWWDRDYEYIPHLNKSHQNAQWLDFQWCQTGHGGEHQPYKVEKMYNNLPIKAVANGEPTYEGIRDPENGSGWWQGHEAWLNFTSGGTMGVVYGAGGLWNWKLFPDEEGWAEWADSKVSWQEAIKLPGSVYVGYMKKALQDLDLTDIERHSELAEGNLCLAKPGELYVIYLPKGGSCKLEGIKPGMTYQWFNPKTGEFVDQGEVENRTDYFNAKEITPMVLIVKS